MTGYRMNAKWLGVGVLAITLELAGATQVLPAEPVKAQRQMVVAAHPLAASAGLEILRQGGNAVDAAIAVQMVLTLVEPQSSGIGGGGFLLAYDGRTRTLAAYDGRETAPAAATADMFLHADGSAMEFEEAVVGGLSVGVPGILRMLELAHRERGHLPWPALFEPAIRLAEQGFEVSPRLYRLLEADEHLKRIPEAAAYFYGTDGLPRARLLNEALAETLRLVARDGADAFYRGRLAADIVQAIRTSPLQPGRVAAADLAGYEAELRAAVCAPYRRWRICSMSPPSSGGIAILQMLILMEPFALRNLAPDSAAAVHLITQASRLAFADRDRYVADPDKVAVPVRDLLDPSYLRERGRLIDGDRDMGKAMAGRLRQKLGWAVPLPQVEPVSTSQVSIVDAKGNAVSLTTTIEGPFGSRLFVGGFLLNNELTDFAFQPVRDGQPVANRVEPHKRPRSSMAPTMVLDEQGRLVLVLGSPGGSSIIPYVLKTLVAILDWNLDPQAAVDLPNFANRNGATELEKGTPIEALEPALQAMGHEVKAVEMTSGLAVIQITPEVLLGGADSRREGAALGD